MANVDTVQNLLLQWRIQDLPKGGTRARARSASLNGGLGAEPQRGPGAEPLVGGQGGEAPLKLKAFCTFLHEKVAKSGGFT